MSISLADVAAAFGSAGVGLAAGIKGFGLLCDLLKARMEEKRKGRTEDREDASQIFRQALDFIQAQNQRIAELRQEMDAQEAHMRSQIEELERKVNTLQQENLTLRAQLMTYERQQSSDQARIQDLEAKVQHYEQMQKGVN
jgi:chromosome segregation ATPase